MASQIAGDGPLSVFQAWWPSLVRHCNLQRLDWRRKDLYGFDNASFLDGGKSICRFLNLHNLDHWCHTNAVKRHDRITHETKFPLQGVSNSWIQDLICWLRVGSLCRAFRQKRDQTSAYKSVSAKKRSPTKASCNWNTFIIQHEGYTNFQKVQH